MSRQKLLPPPQKTLMLSDHFFRIPQFAVNGEPANYGRWDKAGKPKIIDGGRPINEPPSAPRYMCKPPSPVRDDDWRTPGIPEHLMPMHRLFEIAFIDRCRVFSIYFNRHSTQLESTVHHTPEEAFEENVKRAGGPSRLIICFDVGQDFSAQFHGKNGPYISPLHHLDNPIVTEGTMRAHDPRPEEYWYR